MVRPLVWLITLSALALLACSEASGPDPTCPRARPRRCRARTPRCIRDRPASVALLASALAVLYVHDEGGELLFHPLPAPSAEEVAEVAARTHAGILRVLELHGRSLGDADDTPDELAAEQPVLASWAALADALTTWFGKPERTLPLAR